MNNFWFRDPNIWDTFGMIAKNDLVLINLTLATDGIII